jgi:hypothetical protein
MLMVVVGSHDHLDICFSLDNVRQFPHGLRLIPLGYCFYNILIIFGIIFAKEKQPSMGEKL